MALFAIVPWILFGIMVLFGLIFAIVAWRATRRAGDMADTDGDLAGGMGRDHH